ncbi:hypothetical protein BVRB_6g143760 [Beta vulgaris subsp. vulgaris]|nr:hypothetical protein BVRB_6g143760 [Beta vulgaris subsp. vulgaris]
MKERAKAATQMIEEKEKIEEKKISHGFVQNRNVQNWNIL